MNAAFGHDVEDRRPLFEDHLAKGEEARTRNRLTEGALGSVHLHPFRPYLMAVSGSRLRSAYDAQDDAESVSSSDSDTSDDSDSRDDLTSQASPTVPSALPSDDALRIWSFAASSS